MTKKVCFMAFILTGFLLASCASVNQVAQQNSSDEKTIEVSGFDLLEQKLIEEYLAHTNLEQLQQEEEEEVLVYNLRDELEYQGKAKNTDARILILKGDFLIDMNNMQIYRINK